MSINPLLARQLRRYLAGTAPPAALAPLLAAVSAAYDAADQERVLTERALELSSQELRLRYEQLQVQLKGLQVSQQALENSLAILGATLDATEDGVLVVNLQGSIVTVNARFQQLFGLDAEIQGLHRGVHLATRMRRMLGPELAAARRLRRALRTPGEIYRDILPLKDGRYLSAYASPQKVGAAVLGQVWCFRDITEQRRHEDIMRHQAGHDALTGLPNRYRFQETLAELAHQPQLGQAGCAVLFIDLDNFKLINDALGHRVGDEILMEVARRLRQTLPPEAFVARIGGDEFVVLLPQVAHHDAPRHIAEGLMASLDAGIVIGEQSFAIHASIGVARYPQDGAEPGTLVSRADLAMYEAKRRGKHGVCVFSEKLGAALSRHFDLALRLPQALARGEFFLEFQPKLRLADGEPCGAEALLRWQLASGRRIPPAEFIPIAEHSNLIWSIGAWTLREAVRYLAEHALPPDFGLAVNLSARQLSDPDLAWQLRRLLAEYGQPPERLELEITETAIMENPEQAIELLHELRAIGVSLAIDDFGTGYSSLNYLRQLPICTLKLDSAFIAELNDREQSRAIVSTVLQLARTLGLATVAEGIEDAPTAVWLASMGCDIAQGYHYARPMAGDALVDWVRARRR